MKRTMSQKVRKKKPKSKKVSFKDKDWYEVFSPRSFDNKSIGEIIGLENNIVGRTLETSLFDFTNNFRDINLKVKFRIVSVNNEAKTCQSVFHGHEFSSDHVRSLIGRGTSKIQTIINLTTKDNFIFRVTTICTTIKRARSSQQIIIRKIMREILKEFAQSLNHEKFVRGMIYGEFQHQIRRIAKTIYPLSSSTVIKSKLISIPEGGEDKLVPDDDFEIVEVDVKRSRKSEMRRTERINVKKLARKSHQTRAPPAPAPAPNTEEAKEPEKAPSSEESKEE